MTRSSLRVRLAVGTAVLAGAGGALIAQTASASAPPSEPPSSDSGAAPAGGDHDTLVDAIISTSAEGGLPMNRDCVAGIVEQIPDEDVATIISEIEASAAVADITMPDISMPDISMPQIEIPDISMPDLQMPDISMPDLGDISIPEIELPDISMPDLADISIPPLPDLSIPSVPIPDLALSAETLALSRELVTCVEGDADPALVEQVVALAESSTPPGVLDLACASKMLSTFPDEVLQQIIDNGAVQADPSAVDPAIAAEVAKLLACTDMMASATATAEAPAASAEVAEVAPATTTG